MKQESEVKCKKKKKKKKTSVYTVRKVEAEYKVVQQYDNIEKHTRCLRIAVQPPTFTGRYPFSSNRLGFTF